MALLHGPGPPCRSIQLAGGGRAVGKSQPYIGGAYIVDHLAPISVGAGGAMSKMSSWWAIERALYDQGEAVSCSSPAAPSSPLMMKPTPPSFLLPSLSKLYLPALPMRPPAALFHL